MAFVAKRRPRKSTILSLSFRVVMKVCFADCIDASDGSGYPQVRPQRHGHVCVKAPTAAQSDSRPASCLATPVAGNAASHCGPDVRLPRPCLFVHAISSLCHSYAVHCRALLVSMSAIRPVSQLGTILLTWLDGCRDPSRRAAMVEESGSGSEGRGG